MRYAGRQLGAFALLALLVRAIVPAGYMIASAETPDGRYMVVQLCDSHAGFSQIIDLETGNQIDPASIAGKTNKPGSDKSKAPCVFASAPHSSVHVALQDIAAPTIAITHEPIAKTVVSPGRGIAAPPPPATGPPNLA